MNEMILLIFVLLSAVPTLHVSIKMKKQNIYIAQNSNYTFRIVFNQSKSQLNPINITLSHEITNSMPTINQYFDYFKYLSDDDIQCYNESIGNSSYLFPCPFLSNNDSILKVSSITEQYEKASNMRKGLNQIDQNFIVDNTPYPFPTGSYPYSQLQITSTTDLLIIFNDQYRSVGIRLIFITITMLLIYGVSIGILVYRTKKIQKELLERAPDYNLKKRVSDISRDNGKKIEEEDESDIDNYDQIGINQNSLRESRSSKVPSLLSSSDNGSRVFAKHRNDY